MSDDALIGLRFEVSGGLGKMMGRVLGKVGSLYLVQKSGAAYFELLEIDDLRSAKFFSDTPEVEPQTSGRTEKRRKLSDHIRRAVQR